MFWARPRARLKGLPQCRGNRSVPEALAWGNMSAVAILATIPVFVITLAFQRQIVEGITSGMFK